MPNRGASQLGVVTSVSKIIPLISLADIMLTSQSLNYTLARGCTDPPGTDEARRELTPRAWTLRALPCPRKASF